MDETNRNLDEATVSGFGDEWSRFDQSTLDDAERAKYFDDYFHIFDWDSLPEGARGVDVGCGSGRWALLVADRIGHLECVDASVEALEVARRNLSEKRNVSFTHVSVDALPFEDGSLDFGYSLGVLHHVPDTAAAIGQCVRKLKVGAPFLLYLYYAFDNRPAWFRMIWQTSELVRRRVSRASPTQRQLVTDALAAGVYLPLARASWLLDKAGRDVSKVPLSYYRDSSFYTMRTDARDRFGTQLEQRFTRAEITAMMTAAGLDDIRFSDRAPYWCAVGRRAG